jgi:sulfide:quinone oxidoreductase
VVVIAGGGFAAMESALAVRAMAGERAHVCLVAPDPDFTFAPAATRSAFAAATGERTPMRDLAERAGAALIGGNLGEVRPDLRRIVLTGGRELEYDHLVVAVGARTEAWLDAPGLLFRGPRDEEALGDLLRGLVRRAMSGDRLRVAFTVPVGPGWAVPAYELALLTAQWLTWRGVREAVELEVVTAEDEPLGVFGHDAAEAVTAELAEAGVEVYAGAVVRGWADGWLHVVPDGRVPADLVVSLPVLRGPRVAGLPHTQLGFVAADQDGRVVGSPGVYVAGDAGPFPVKQAGLACQQADAVAALIAAELGAHVAPHPAAPTLRALLWTGRGDRFLRTDLAGGRDESGGVGALTAELWWPPGKVAGRFLTPFLEGAPESARLVDLDVPEGVRSSRAPGRRPATAQGT